jgi:nicotinic acid mononucleotide adenylyltransferase
VSKIAFYGGSFNPPTQAHRAIVDDLLEGGFFYMVLVKPCGIRADKPELIKGCEARKEEVQQVLGRTQGHYQLILNHMTSPMRPTVDEWRELKAVYPKDTVYLVTGTDLFVDEGNGHCQVERWIEGELLFKTAFFYIYPRPVEGKLILPPNYHLRQEFSPMDISSSQLRAQRQQEQ